MKNNQSSACYSGYVHKPPKTNWTGAAAVKDGLTYVTFDSDSALGAGGIPIISNGESAYIDTSDNHCAIIGASGFKKSTCVFMPLICTLAKASENMVVLDAKGELYSRTAEYLKSLGYKTIVLNFRDYNGDGYNPLHLPARIWREKGDTDKATAMTNNFTSALAARQENQRSIDIFWPDTARTYINGVLPFMYDGFPDIRSINMLSLADFFTDRTSDRLKDYLSSGAIKNNNTAVMNMKTILAEPERTRMSSLSTAASFIQPFLQNDKLLRMLSNSTFELEDVANEKTALFMVTDDTTSVCDPIISIFLTQLQTVLVEKAFHSPKSKLKTRVNFVLDEFCSLVIPDFNKSIATNRSRDMRYFLCIQSLDALSEKYPHYEGILTNCATTLFLGSTEMRLLEMISTRCGDSNKTASGQKEPLISVPELMTLKRDWSSKEAIYLNLAENKRYCTTLPAIEEYKEFCKYGEGRLPDITHPEISFYALEQLLRDITFDRVYPPFSGKNHF